VGSIQGLLGAGLDGGPDFAGVVFDPTGPRIVLRDFLVALADDFPIRADRDGGRTGRPFVEAQNDLADISGFQVRFRLPVE
jgi:hypothetical protein